MRSAHLTRNPTFGTAWATAIVAAALLGSSTARAESGLSVTIRSGLSVAGVSGRDVYFDPDTKRGYAGAVAVALPVASLVSLEPEVGYAMRGFSWGKVEWYDESGTALGTGETLTATDMICVTLPVRVALPIAGPVRLSLLAGPSVAFEVRERWVITGPKRTLMRADFQRHTDYDGVIGAGADLAAGPGRLGVEGRYVHGFTQLSTPSLPVDYHTGGFEFTTRAFEVTLGYSLRLGHAAD